jgi:hypothetical protein
VAEIQVQVQVQVEVDNLNLILILTKTTTRVCSNLWSKMNPTKARFERDREIVKVIFNYLSSVISNDSLDIEKSLEIGDEDLVVIRALLLEFHFKFILNVKRSSVQRPCQAGLDCLNLRVYIILSTMEEIARGIPLDDISKVIDELLLPTDPRRVATRRYHSCAGTHIPMTIVCTFGDTKRLLEHPIFTTSLCDKIIKTLRTKLVEYTSKCSPEQLTSMNLDDTEEINIPTFGAKPSVREREDVDETQVVPKCCSPEPLDPDC